MFKAYLRITKRSDSNKSRTNRKTPHGLEENPHHMDVISPTFIYKLWNPNKHSSQNFWKLDKYVRKFGKNRQTSNNSKQ